MRMSVRRFVVLFFLSFGLYLYYWYYQSLKQLKEEQELDISPGWRTAGLFVPVLNLFLLYGLFKRIDQAADSVGSEPRHSAGWLLAALIFLPMVLNCIGNQLLTGEVITANPALVWVGLPLRLIYMIPVAWVLSCVLATANGYWGFVRPDMPLPTVTTRGEKAIVVGGILWSLGGAVFSHWFFTWFPAYMDSVISGMSMF